MTSGRIGDAKYDEARAEVQTLIKLNAANDEALHCMGRIYESMDQSGDAVDWFEKAVKANERFRSLISGSATRSAPRRNTPASCGSRFWRAASRRNSNEPWSSTQSRSTRATVSSSSIRKRRASWAAAWINARNDDAKKALAALK